MMTGFPGFSFYSQKFNKKSHDKLMAEKCIEKRTD